MWRERINSLVPTATLAPPATLEALDGAEAQVGSLGADLRSLLLESNGVLGEYDLGLIWPIERIVADNLMFRTEPDFADLYMPFDPLVFFADAGTGDQFAVLGRIDRPDVFAWNHEDDSRAWVAPSLDAYLEWWTTGRITL